MSRLIFVYILWLLPIAALTQKQALPLSNQKDSIVSKLNSDSVPYRLIYPEKQRPSKKYPLLVFLHGMGTRGNDNKQPFEKFSAFFSDSVHANKFDCYILIPLP